jgi:hypothetical protein
MFSDIAEGTLTTRRLGDPLPAGGLSFPKLSGNGWASSQDRKLEAVEQAEGVLLKRLEQRPSMVKVAIVCGSILGARNRGQTGRVSLRTCAGAD